MKWTDICVDILRYDVSAGDNTVQAVHVAKAVSIEARRPYGSVDVRVDCDKITITSFDGDGEPLEKRELKIDDLVSDGTADELSEELKVLDTVRRTTQEAGMGEQPNPLNNGEKETAPGG